MLMDKPDLMKAILRPSALPAQAPTPPVLPITIAYYLATIGGKGGRRGKGTPKVIDPAIAKARAKKASKARWEKYAEDRRRACLAITTE